MRSLHFAPAALAACSFAVIALSSFALSVATVKTAHAQFTTVSLVSVVNNSLQTQNSANPTGSVTLGGVPFFIPTGNNEWNASTASGGSSATQTVTIPINLAGVGKVYTLINTYWGTGQAASFASLTFNYSDGTTFTKSLLGNTDIRDYYQGVYTTGINNTSTVKVFETTNSGLAGAGTYHIDQQMVDVGAFANKTLSSMTITDTGSDGFQRVFIGGLTVQQAAAPEPGSIALLVAGAGITASTRIRRRRQG